MSERNYIVYFEVFGKKIKTTIMAESPEKAKEILKSKIIFHRVVIKEGDSYNKAANAVHNIFEKLNIQ